MKKLRKANSRKSVDFLNTPEKSVRAEYTSKFSALSKYINKFVKMPDFKQNEIAEKLEMHESQVSVWLSGFHNLTLKSILKLESACDIQILNPAIWIKKNSAKPANANNKVEYTLKAYTFTKAATLGIPHTGVSSRYAVNTVPANAISKTNKAA